MANLFDKHELPDLTDLTEDEAWETCRDFEDYVYTFADSVSEDEYDRLLSDVSALYNEYYALFN